MEQVYKRDYIWMRRGAGAPEKVSTDESVMHPKMAAGFRQCAAPEVPKVEPVSTPVVAAEKAEKEK